MVEEQAKNLFPRVSKAIFLYSFYPLLHDYDNICNLNDRCEKETLYRGIS